eukprot:Protomagalhaensia_wolfi_Nauph_80__1996@NODE_2263_length_1145_cov_160_163653_g1768_i0_p1_GENE_NODE_2263_length_1145_cov_160_163653_g1768_i0NODE_2263_length_1145_cov_160_163653_g1768_i0_p1_ORF_typecomplete_len250_score26_27Fbox/PF00646_33/0_012Fboxlike/PF12937_7/0_53Fboxlike/PF12937_7/1_3e02_NODE_2263_length_1145_cov_160_163653_g1768_i069818
MEALWSSVLSVILRYLPVEERWRLRSLCQQVYQWVLSKELEEQARDEVLRLTWGIPLSGSEHRYGQISSWHGYGFAFWKQALYHLPNEPKFPLAFYEWLSRLRLALLHVGCTTALLKISGNRPALKQVEQTELNEALAVHLSKVAWLIHFEDVKFDFSALLESYFSHQDEKPQAALTHLCRESKQFVLCQLINAFSQVVLNNQITVWKDSNNGSIFLQPHLSNPIKYCLLIIKAWSNQAGRQRASTLAL